MKNKQSERIPDTGKTFQSRIAEISQQRKSEEEIKKKEKDDLQNIDYAVLDKGKEIHRTKSINEALNLAKSINGKVWWLIEGSFVSEIE